MDQHQLSHSVSIKQREVLRLLSSGYTQKEVASKLGITIKSLQDRLTSARKAMRARTTCQAIAIFNQAA